MKEDIHEAFIVQNEEKNCPRGKSKSGRVWKSVRTARFSAMKKDKCLTSSWERKMKKKAEMKSIKDFENRLKDERKQTLELRRKRREEHKKRREANEKKSEVVQVIKNTAKIKRMKKKQLRKIEKR
ncbi:coiled-coil domain-containing protein 86-like [Gigantopelta aegis]|uniref:coiled-coil domain-containing protein 86-like n=1 Tax=Gigantopelta aegis TaxID=1735272 RepID=UPI001B88B693|nr:coiled-coil domain-containing protein 86-like [Gigantopelta aegis]